MKIALIGATGFAGKAILLEFLDRNHEVTGISRHPEKLGFHHPGLHNKAGNMLDENEAATLLSGHEAVVSAYNAGWTNPDLHDEYLRGCRSILNGIKKAGVKRFLTIGGAGSLEVAPGLQFLDTPAFPAQFKAGALAAREFLEIIKKENGLDWTYLSPAIVLTPGSRKGTYRTALDNPVYGPDGKCTISVEDLAVAVVDEIEKPQHIRQRFTVGY
jgi:putative NADH-flavin reductase